MRRIAFSVRIHASVVVALLSLCHVAVAAAVSELALIPNQGSGTVSLIDTARDVVIQTIPDHGSLGGKLQAVVVGRGGGTAYVIDADANALLSIDLATGRIVRSIGVGKGPEGAAVSPSGKWVAVCVEDDNTVVLVNAANGSIADKIATQGKNPEHCAFSSDSRWLMTSNEISNDVDIIDLNARRSVGVVRTAGHPRGIAWLPNKAIAYVAQETGGCVDVIDVVHRRAVRSIATGLRPAGIVASPDGRRMFVTNGGDGTVTVIDTSTFHVLATIAVGKRPWNMAMTHDAKKLYVANGRSNSVSVIDTRTLNVIAEISVGQLPWGVAMTHKRSTSH